MQKETAIKNAILLALGDREDALAWNAPVGTFRAFDDPSRVIRIGPVGRADIIGVVAGRALAIEVKTATGRLHADQQRWREAFEKVGGLWVLARSPEEAMDALRG